MRILIIDNSVAYTGAVRAAMNQAQILADRHQFIFVVPPGEIPLMLRKRGFRTYVLPLREIRRPLWSWVVYPVFLLRNGIALRRILKKERIDIIQVNDFYNLLGALVKITGFQGKVITYVRLMPDVFPPVLRKIWVFAAQKFSHRVIAVSDAVLGRLPPHRHTIRIYDPVFLQENSQIVPKPAPVQFLYLANYIRGKGQEDALSAFQLAFARNKHIRLRFVGGDMNLQKNQKFRASLETRVHEKQLSAYITFDGFRANVESEIKQAHVVLNFSVSESFSMTCLEAAYYQRPVITTDCGGPSEIVEHLKTGVVVPVGDVEKMADAMILLANDATLRHEWGAAARKIVEERFGASAYEREMERVFRD